MKKIARVILTFDCPRKCAGCCNTYSTIMAGAKTITDIKSLKDYDEVIFTGGEPMLNPQRIVDLSGQLKGVALSKCKIYLYTAYHKSFLDMRMVLPHVDGIQYSLHEGATNSDIIGFDCFQLEAVGWKTKSFRLFIDNRVHEFVKIMPNVWNRVEIKPWLTEAELLKQQTNGLPSGEELFVLK